LPHANLIKKSLVFGSSRGYFSVQLIRDERHGDAMGRGRSGLCGLRGADVGDGRLVDSAI